MTFTECAPVRDQPRTPSLGLEDVGSHVLAAAQGDAHAWERIVTAYAGLVWTIARRYRLDANDASDVSQVVWLRLLENIGSIREPDRLGGWLVTTTRRESLRAANRRRHVPAGNGDDIIDLREVERPEPDSAMLLSEQAVRVQTAIETLPLRWRQLLHLLMQDPPISYGEISRQLNMPIGSIGPTRARCLRQIRDLLGTTEWDLEGRIPRQSRDLTRDSRP